MKILVKFCLWGGKKNQLISYFLELKAEVVLFLGAESVLEFGEMIRWKE